MGRATEDRRAGAQLGYAKPQTYEELLAVLQAGTAQLSRRSRQAAVYLTQHPEEAALGSISAVAAAVGVQPSTLVRFAQVFGFSGWSELQEVFKAHLRAGGAGRREAGPFPDRLAGLVGAAQASLARLPETLDPAAFDRMALALAGAPAVTLIGAKRAFPVVSYLALTFSQHGLRANLVSHVGGNAEGEVACLGPQDTVLAVSFSPYNSATPELAQIARDRGARVLALTDSPLSPLLPLAEASLVVVEKAEAGYRTLAATMVVALALGVEVAARRAAGRGRD